MTAMELVTSQRDGVTVVTMGGDLEVQEIEDFKSVMDQAFRQGPNPKVVLDVAAVTRMTSYVVALIGFYNAHFKKVKGLLVVAGPTSPARRALELSGLTSVITSADSVEEALEIMKS